MLLPWHVLHPLITDTLVAEQQEASQPSHFHFGVFWLGATLHEQETAQASLLRLPIAFSRVGKKQNGSDFQFALSRAEKKRNGSNFQLVFSRAGWFTLPGKTKWSRLPICFFPGREKAKWFRLPIYFFPTREKAKWIRLAIWARKKQNCADFQFVFSRPGKKQFASQIRNSCGCNQTGGQVQINNKPCVCVHPWTKGLPPPLFPLGRGTRRQIADRV